MWRDLKSTDLHFAPECCFIFNSRTPADYFPLAKQHTVKPLKVDLHGTSLPHTTSLRQAYEPSCRFDLQETIHVVGLT